MPPLDVLNKLLFALYLKCSLQFAQKCLGVVFENTKPNHEAPWRPRRPDLSLWLWDKRNHCIPGISLASEAVFHTQALAFSLVHAYLKCPVCDLPGQLPPQV